MKCVIVLVTLIGVSFQMTTTPHHTTGSHLHATTHDVHAMSTIPHHTTGSHHHHTTHEPSEQVRLTFTYDSHTPGMPRFPASAAKAITYSQKDAVRLRDIAFHETTVSYIDQQQMVIHQGHNCYVFALSAQEKADVHTDAGMAQLEAKLLPMIFAGNMTHVDHHTADIHVKRLCGTNQIYMVAK